MKLAIGIAVVGWLLYDTFISHHDFQPSTVIFFSMICGTILCWATGAIRK